MVSDAVVPCGGSRVFICSGGQHFQKKQPFDLGPSGVRSGPTGARSGPSEVTPEGPDRTPEGI